VQFSKVRKYHGSIVLFQNEKKVPENHGIDDKLMVCESKIEVKISIVAYFPRQNPCVGK